MELLARDEFKPLKKKRVGVLTHGAAIDHAGRTALGLLAVAPDVTIAHVLLPATGWNPADGAADSIPSTLAEKLSAGTPQTILAPTQALPADLFDETDILLIDLQDDGTRFSPYPTAIARLMEAAYLNEIPVLVLDRPTVRPALVASGPIQDPALYGRPETYYPMPVTHGLTTGELATLFNTFYGIGAELEVIKMQRWSRTWRWSETGRAWSAGAKPGVIPATAEMAPLYGLAEAAGLSVNSEGRAPVISHPNIDGATLASVLNAQAALGLTNKWKFAPTRQGVTLQGQPPRRNDPVMLGLALLAEAAKQGVELNQDQLLNRLGSKVVLDAINSGKSISAIKGTYEETIVGFRAVRSDAILYRE